MGARLTGAMGHVTGTVPAGFAAYARILHPAEGDDRTARWSEVARAAGTETSAPQDCWFCLWNGYGWIHGSPSVTLMSFHDGGTLTEDRDVAPAYPADWMTPESEVRHPYREYLLGRGPLGAASGIGHQVSDDWFIPQSPNLFWPADRSWCVATEIDFDSTLVGGSSRLINDLLETSHLETWPIAPDDSLQFGADRINDHHGDR